MMKINHQWNGDGKNGAKAVVMRASWEAIKRVTVYFWTAVQNAINVSNPRPYITPSKPGEPPRKRTGWFAANVIYELDEQKQEGRVGVTQGAIYGIFLELVMNRPWLLSTLRKVMPQLQGIVAATKQKAQAPQQPPTPPAPGKTP